MRRLERAGGVLSLLAGGIHGLAAPEHFSEWWGYGLFFLAATTGQLVYGLLLLSQGIEGWGGWPAVRGSVYLAGVVGNLAIMALWIVTRTVGVPAGPETGSVDAVGLLDAVSKLLETGLVGCLALLLLALRKQGARDARTSPG